MFHLGAALLQNLAVSPELTLRPSLSGHAESLRDAHFRRVAGANAPAFVERRISRSSEPRMSSVAGANAPAFVERTTTATRIAAKSWCRRS